MQSVYQVFSVIALFLIMNAAKAQINENAIAGDWYSEELDKSLLRISKSNEGLWIGVIIKSSDSKKVGKTILTEGRFHPDKQNWAGKLKTAMGINVNCVLSISGSALKLVGTKSFITKTYFWNRQ